MGGWREWGDAVDEKRRFDWRTLGAMLVMLVGQAAVEYGIMSTQISELGRRVERIEQKLDDRMLPRDEFEKRHQDLEKRFEELREQVQELEMDKVRRRN